MTADANRTARKRSWAHALLRAGILVVAFVGLVAFSVVLAKVTLTPSPASAGIAHSNMTPGRSLRQYAEDYTFLAACKQAGGNILLGAPFGVLIPVLVPRRLRMLRMILLTVVVMVIVELAQGAVVEGRAFDIDDVILNTTGALLGYLFVGRRVSHHYHSFAKVRPEPAPATAPAAGETSGGRPTRSTGRAGLRERVAAATAKARAADAKKTPVPAEKSGAGKVGSERAGARKAGSEDARAGKAGAARPGGGRTLLERLRNR
ncbi:VanZ family protein [Streptomyces sp. NBC_00102]|uniref:VanZ family protein n=1 Tax=Streptomyces sp. NBC_00102 TaxID=2975652 RepID=UPI00224D1E6F|nr:VanZ family protein [Streptomyces sp. NBC_00102]MCX5401356.1 VanZ family protein [Streptomyces sp. NBC_00102]